MAETFKLPGIGETKKTYVFAGLAVATIAAGVIYYRRKENAAASTTASTDATSTEIDPATGYIYGSPDDVSALQAQTAVGTGDGGGTADDTPTTDNSTTAGLTTNAQWTQAAQNYLTDTVGLASGTVSSALGPYIAGEGVTDAQKSVIQQAIAGVGSPPQSGTNGFPPSIRLKATSTVSTPRLATPTGLKVAGGQTATTELIQWKAVAHATSYTVAPLSGRGFTTIASGPGTRVARGEEYTVTAHAHGYDDSYRSAPLTVK